MPNKPESKRGRSELSSAEEEISLAAELKSIKESLSVVNSKLQKLDMLDQLAKDKTDMQHSLDFYMALVDTLKEDNASLRLEVNCLKQLTTKFQNDNTTFAENILDIQCRSMRDNIILHGIPEENKETYQISEQLVKKFMKEQLNMDQRVVQDIQVARAHRVGKPRGASERPRPIVTKLVAPKDKSTIMARGQELKGSTFSMTDQFPQEIMKRRRLLYPVMAEAKKNNKRVRLMVDKLIIDGSLYRNSKITYWLSGGGGRPVSEPERIA
ncbi:unnamed protein product [Knipowitschia caucasica]